MAKIPKQRKPGQTGNWAGQGQNASTFNNRQKAKRGCLTVIFFGSLILTGIAGIASNFV
jgi:hypothetical protein